MIISSFCLASHSALNAAARTQMDILIVTKMWESKWKETSKSTKNCPKFYFVTSRSTSKTKYSITVEGTGKVTQVL